MFFSAWEKETVLPLADATLSQLLQGWWQELPSWERRARGPAYAEDLN